jgi:polyphosphate glucokinase
MIVSDAKCKVLSVDIGGSRIKATVLDIQGTMLREYVRIDTPSSGIPADIIKAIQQLTADFEAYDLKPPWSCPFGLCLQPTV